jgi:hypothetical protein
MNKLDPLNVGGATKNALQKLGSSMKLNVNAPEKDVSFAPHAEFTGSKPKADRTLT